MLKIGFLAFNKVQAMDLIAPYEFLDVWQQSIKTEYIELSIIGENQAPISCSNSRFNLIPDYSFTNAPQFDYLFIPGGIGRQAEVQNSATINFIKNQFSKCQKILSICTGTFLLLEAGLLSDSSATTYWRALPELKANHKLTQEQRIVKNSRIWTAGGISSGIDLALELINEIAGQNQANLARLIFEYFPLTASLNQFELEQLKPYSNHTSKIDDIAGYIKNILISKLS